MSDSPAYSIMSTDQLLSHWQGHRDLTRRLLEVYPEEQLFTFSVGSMRPFGALILEMLSMAVPTVNGIATGDWGEWSEGEPRSKVELLQAWDESTAEINRVWPRIPEARFQQEMTAFGQWPGTGWSLLFYAIDNEIHHRGQAYVYLRALGIAPPEFYARYPFVSAATEAA